MVKLWNAMSSTRVALVTGANQGIGLEIVRQLCKLFEGKVLLAARSATRGEEAVKKLQEEGLTPELITLDVANEESIAGAKDIVERKYGRLDVLINNAAVLFRMDSGLTLHEKAKQTIATNYYGVLKVTNIFTPLLQPNSRVVNLSTGLGKISYISEVKQTEVLAPDLTVEGLSAIMDQFVKDTQSPDYDSKGWPPSDGNYSSYSVSKIGVNRLTELQAKIFSQDPTKNGTLVNAVCPGWVQTRMGTAAATYTVEQGADTPVYVALLPPGTKEPNGVFLRHRTLAKWK